MKKRTAFILAVVLTASFLPARAAESWREAFITRLMSLMSRNPAYQEVALTDLDFNGIPEAFLISDSVSGGIGEGITMQGGVITSINVPGNVVGRCLEDITVYQEENGELRAVGKEVGRYTGDIEYYYMTFDGQTLTCQPTQKEVFAALSSIPYTDVYSHDLFENGYPSRTKLAEFINSYIVPNNVRAQLSTDEMIINGERVDIVGYNINYSNYYKVRDIAMLLRTTSVRFNVVWDESLGGVNIITGQRYEIVGGELDLGTTEAGEIAENSAPVYVNGNISTLESYNIDGNNYFKIRDLADAVGFTVDYDASAGQIRITAG